MQVMEEISNRNLGCAMIAAACISRSYKVESTRNTASLFMDVRSGIEVGSSHDVVSCVLTAARLMDLAIEVKNPSSINDVYMNFRGAVAEHGGEPGTRDFWASVLASASVSQSSRVETVRETVALWSEYRDKLPDMDPLDRVAVLLAKGRIIDLSTTSLSFAEILSTVENIKSELVSLGARETSMEGLAAAMMTAAYITVTSKVESLKDIVATWDRMRGMFSLEDETDLICAILTSGNVTDLDAMSILTPFSIPDQLRKLRQEILAAGGAG